MSSSDKHPQGGDLFDMAKDGTKGIASSPIQHPR